MVAIVATHILWRHESKFGTFQILVLMIATELSDP